MLDGAGTGVLNLGAWGRGGGDVDRVVGRGAVGRGLPGGKFLSLSRQRKEPKKGDPAVPHLRGGPRRHPLAGAAAQLALAGRTRRGPLRRSDSARRFSPPTGRRRGGTEGETTHGVPFPLCSGPDGRAKNRKKRGGCLSPQGEFPTRPVFGTDGGGSRRPAKAGCPSFGSFSWASKKRNLPPGNPRPPTACLNAHAIHRQTHPYWQASQVGSSIAQNFTSVAASTAVMPPCAGTALSSPPRPVDFSADVAARVRR